MPIQNNNLKLEKLKSKYESKIKELVQKHAIKLEQAYSKGYNIAKKEAISILGKLNTNNITTEITTKPKKAKKAKKDEKAEKAEKANKPKKNEKAATPKKSVKPKKTTSRGRPRKSTTA